MSVELVFYTTITQRQCHNIQSTYFLWIGYTLGISFLDSKNESAVLREPSTYSSGNSKL